VVGPDLVTLEPQLRQLVEKSLAANPNHMPVPASGAILGVRVPGQPDLVLAVGVDGLKGSPPLAADGRFLASFVSARFTTMVALKLIDQGLLDGKATLDTWIPDYPNAAEITVEMLLDASSGMPALDESLVDLVLPDLQRVWTPSEVMTAAASLAPLSAPGIFDSVTNGPGLGAANAALAFIIEKVTGNSLAAAVDTYVTGPLGLHDSSIFDGVTRPADLQDGVFALPDGSAASMKTVPNAAYMSFGFGEWGVATTARDLLTFTESVATGTLLGPETTARTLDFDLSQAGQGASGGRGFFVGRGLVNGYCLCDKVTQLADVMAIGFRGGSVGSNTVGLYLPGSGITIALHANADGGAPESLQRALVDVLVGA
jgi:D-alanyl-D-alanine carboxypeptidase